jgi:hypothetical protein
LAVLAASFQCEPHGIWVRHIAIKRHQDGSLLLGCSVALQQHQGGRDGAEIGAARGGANQQHLAGGSGVGKVIGGAMTMRLALVIDQSLDMGGVLDPLAPAVTAPMAGQYPRGGIEAQPVAPTSWIFAPYKKGAIVGIRTLLPLAVWLAIRSSRSPVV